MKPEVKRFPNLKELSESAAELILNIAEKAVAEKGTCTMAISGGNTPKTLFELLAESPYKEKMPWDKIHIFWVDERCVPDDHPESNFSMAFTAFISKVPLLTENIRPILSGIAPPSDTAVMYEGLLRSSFNMDKGKGFPSFDLVLLGMGTDGHTASLFPNSPSLAESKKWVVAVEPPDIEPSVVRITMTLPAINNACNVVFIVSGKGKKDVSEAILDDREKAAEKYPAARVNPSGNLYWFLFV